MKICTACGNKQEEGNFCGRCGAKVESQAATTVNNQAPITEQKQPENAATEEISTSVAPVVEQQPNEQLEKVKAESKRYFAYFMQQLKTPSAQIDRDQLGFKNGLISICLYILVTAIAIHMLVSGGLAAAMGGFSSYYSGPSLLQTIFSAGIFIAVIVGITILAIFVTAKLFSGDRSFKDIVGNIGSYFVVPVAFSIVALLLVIVKSFIIGLGVLYIGASIAFGVIPIFVMIKLLSIRSKRIDSLYAFLFYMMFTGVLFLIAMIFVGDSIIGQLGDLF